MGCVAQALSRRDMAQNEIHIKNGLNAEILSICAENIISFQAELKTLFAQ